MSQCCAEDRDVVRSFANTICRIPSFLEEPKKGTLRKNTAKVVKELRNRLSTTVFRLLVTARSTEQFKELFRELFPQYVEVSTAIATFVRMDRKAGEEPTDSALFSHIRDRLSGDDWLMPLHEGAREEAVFCLDSLHRAHLLSQDVAALAAAGELQPEDYLKPYGDAILQEWWSLLHLRCLLFAMQHKIRPTVDVFRCLMDGFRNSVMAYAHARAAIESKYRSDYSSIDLSGFTPDNDQECSAVHPEV
jgi:hypothetical protein